MQFMLIMIPKVYRDAPSDFKPDPQQMVDMQAFNESLDKAGVLKSVNGLMPPAQGARLSFGVGGIKVTHGPFPNTTEPFGGYWIVNLKSQDEAVEWMKKCPAQPGDIIEIRQIASED